MTLRKLPATSSIALAALFATTGVAEAQTKADSAQPADGQTDGGLGDIVVTAQRRAQSLQDVSVAVTALNAESLERLGVGRVDDLAQHVPNLGIKSVYGTSRPSIFLRGIGFDSFNAIDGNTVSVSQDELVIEARAAQLAQMFDVERVEVLRGPQGTLYGRNTTGGAINIYSVLPKFTTEGYARLSYGRFDAFELEAATSLPVVDDVLAVRVAGTMSQSDGYVRNLFSDRGVENDNRWAARAILLFKPSENQQWVLSLAKSRSDVRGGTYFQEGILPGNKDFLGYSNPAGFWTLNNNAPTFERVDTSTASLKGTIEFGGATLTSISGYSYADSRIREDSDASPANLLSVVTADRSRQFSQELRVSGKKDRLNWIVGAFYFHEKIQGNNSYEADLSLLDPANGKPEVISQRFRQLSESYAAFGQLDYEFVDRVTITAGLRWTHDSKRYTQTTIHPIGQLGTSFTIPDTERSYSRLTGRFGFEFRPIHGLMAYATYNRGYRAGQPSGLAFGSAAEFTFVNPETVNAYEAGIKADLLDRRLRTNLAVFYNKFRDLQVVQFVPSGALNILNLLNAAGAETYGVEAEIVALPVPELTLSLSGSWLRARYKNFTLNGTDMDGRDLVNAPKLSLSASAEYRIFVGGGTLSPSIEYNYRTSQLLLLSNTEAFDRGDGTAIPFREKSYGLLNASIAFEPEGAPWNLSLFARNLANVRYRTNLIDVSGLGLFEEKRGRPATYGAAFRLNF